MSASPAAKLAQGLVQGAGGKGKKAAGLAGLFSEILSQAQKSLGMKSSESSKASSLLKGEGKGAIASHAAAGEKAKTSASAAKGKRQEPLVKVPAPSSAKGALEPAVARTAPERASGQASKPREQRHSGEAKDAGEAESRLKSVADERRRAKKPGEPAPDESAAARVALAASKAPPFNAVAAKAKDSGETGEADSVGAGKKQEGASRDPKLNVVDLRRSVESRRDAVAKVEGQSRAEEPAKEGIRETKPGGRDAGSELVRDLALDSGSKGASPSGKAEGGLAAGRGADFQSLLAERMREAWNGEIVKSAHLVLRDGDAGTIRLRLRPESLGNVKIELNLSDNNISGRIVVESDEAKTAFERNMSQLSDAFRQGGFDSAKLEVAVGGGSGGGANGKGADAGDPAGPFYSERLRSAVGSAADPATAVSAYSRRGGAVDMLA